MRLRNIIPEMTSLVPHTHQWSDLASRDFTALDRARAIAILPLGATEQHGPHLPLSVDTDLAQAMVQSAMAQLPPDLPALLLPVQAIGYSPEHATFAGTLTLKAETVLRLWTDIAESVLASGVRKLLLFNTHGGNVGLMDVAARDWRTRLGMLVFSASWFNLPLIESDGKDTLQRFAATEQRFGVHGGQIETAMMLALSPDRVRTAQLGNFSSTAEQRARDFAVLGNGRSAKFAWAMQDLNTQGAAGNAAAATPQDGQALIDATGRALATLIEEIDRLPADTIRSA